jgi:hypothetical protein
LAGPRALSVADALRFVREQGVVLLSARGPVPSFAERVTGEPIRGSWWGHPRSHEIYRLAEAVEDSGEVLTCRLIDGKVTWVHRRLWPALLRLADRFPREGLARVWSEHTASGAHRRREISFPEWVPDEVRAAAKSLSAPAAEEQLAVVLEVAGRRRSHP